MGEFFSGAVTENMARHDFLPLPGFEPVDGVYELRIANEMEERQYTDLAVLEAVEHPADMEVLMTPEGMPILFASPQLPAEAVTDQERAYFALVAMLGALMQASIFGSVAGVLQSSNMEYAEHTRVTTFVAERLKVLDVPDALADRVLLYYDNLWHYHRASSSENNAWVNNLSDPLRLDVMMTVAGELLLGSPFLRDVEAGCLEEIVLRLSVKVFMEGDVITHQGERASWMAFVSRGECAVLLPQTQSKLPRASASRKR